MRSIWDNVFVRLYVSHTYRVNHHLADLGLVNFFILATTKRRNTLNAGKRETAAQPGAGNSARFPYPALNQLRPSVHCLPNSAWVDESLVERWMEHPNHSQPNPGPQADSSTCKCKVCLISPGTDLPREWALLALGSFPGLLRQTLHV